MAFITAIVLMLTVVIVGGPIIWVLAFYEPKNYRELIDLEDQRRRLQRQILEKASSADWLTRWRFKRYMRKGG